MSDRIVSTAAGASLGLAVLLRSTLRVPVFGDAREAAEPWLLSSLPSIVWLLASLIVGAGLGYLLPRRRAAPLLWTGLAAIAFVPGAFAAAPFTAAFSGRLLDLVIVIALGLALFRVAPEISKATANRAGLAALAVYLTVGFKSSADVGLSGDEPHYLLVTHSLVRDGDLRVENNYLAEDYRAFYGGKIGPHLARDTPYSVHGVGLPLLLAPGYAVAGLAGVVVTLALLGALVVKSVFRAGEILTASVPASTLAAAAFGLTMPALFLSVSAYPELPAAAVVMLLFVRLAGGETATTKAALGWSALAGTLPFFHMKFVPLALVSWLGLGYRFSSRRARFAILAGSALTAIALASFFYVTTGSIDPTSAYGRQRVFLSTVPAGILGLLFDQEFGLLPYAPVYLAGIAGLLVLARRRPFLGVASWLVLASVALVGAAHPLWSGGNSPPARFLFPALPLLGVAAGCLWAWERKQGIAPWLPSLFVFSVAIGAFTLLLRGQPLYLNARDGTGQLWEALSSSWDLTSYLPSIIASDPRSLVWAAIGLAVIVTALVLQYRRCEVWLPAFPVLLLVAAWAQDLTGVERSREQEGRWVSDFMRRFADEPPSRFVALPAFEHLDAKQTSERVPLRLEPLIPDGDVEHWWSLPYSIPAGRYRVGGVVAGDWSPCNDRNCFEPEGTAFDSAVGLARFRLRARRLSEEPRLFLESVPAGSRPAPVAERSLPISGGRRLHGLDDEAYLDRKGFWVKSGAEARFVVEPGGELFLSNGGRVNTVFVRSLGGEERFVLDPWQRAAFTVPSVDGASPFRVESESGFRPTELDPEATDHRALGVLVLSP